MMGAGERRPETAGGGGRATVETSDGGGRGRRWRWGGAALQLG